MRDAVPDAKGGDALLVDWVPAGGVVDVVIVGVVPGGGEMLALAALEMDAALAGLVDVAAHDAMPGAAVDFHPPVSHIPDGASDDSHVRAAIDDNPTAASGFDQEAAEAGM